MYTYVCVHRPVDQREAAPQGLGMIATMSIIYIYRERGRYDYTYDSYTYIYIYIYMYIHVYMYGPHRETPSPELRFSKCQRKT